jgi:glycosyltransferase involved in cell wall biosynthesis
MSADAMGADTNRPAEPSGPVDRPSVSVSIDVSAIPVAPGGAGRYVLELAGALGRRSDVDLVAWSRRNDADRWAAVLGPGAAVHAAAPNRRPLRLAWEQLMLPALLGSSGAAVHHGPHYTMPERAMIPVVVTIHDCTFFDHPEWHERTKVPVFRRAIRRAARRAAALVCVSETTAAHLRRVCDVRAPIVVAPHGVDHHRFAPAEPAPGTDHEMLGRLGIPSDRPLVVFVGTSEPRKGLAGLVEAFDRVAERRPDALLVIAGALGWGTGSIERALALATHAGSVRRTGYVPDDAVPALLRSATVVAYPSIEEGYGLPALEALACGAPLITTSGTAMAEMAGAGAVLVPAGDVRALAAALEAALDHPDDADTRERRRQGLAVAAARTWDASAQIHVEAYRLAVDG